MHDLIPLTSLRPGEKACVEQVVGAVELVRHLEELGVRGGVSIEMVRTGSPCIVRLEGNKLCFRSGELLRVLVRSGVGA